MEQRPITPVLIRMDRGPILLFVLLAGCARGPEADLQYIKQARSLAAEWALINEQANAGRLTRTYVQSMHQWLRSDLGTAFSSLTQPDTRYADEMRSLLAESADARPEKLRGHAEALKRIEEHLESA